MCNIRIFIAEIGIGLLLSWKTNRDSTYYFLEDTIFSKFLGCCINFVNTFKITWFVKCVNFVQYFWCVQFIHLSILSNFSSRLYLHLRFQSCFLKPKSTLFGVVVPTSISIILTPQISILWFRWESSYFCWSPLLDHWFKFKVMKKPKWRKRSCRPTWMPTETCVKIKWKLCKTPNTKRWSNAEWPWRNLVVNMKWLRTTRSKMRSMTTPVILSTRKIAKPFIGHIATK